MATTAPATTHRLPAVRDLLRSNGLWLWLIVAAGSTLRLQQFIFNRSFWHDETLLATAFVDRGFAQLVFEPLANNQAAPVGYLVLVKLVTVLLGTHEWTLRLVSLLSGLATLPLALAVARLSFSSFVARATLVGLVAVSPVLVYYSTEFKQYQGDVLGTLLILWLTLRFRPDHCREDAFWLALAGAIGIWCSHAIDFVLAGSGLALWLEMARRRDRRAWLAVNAVGLVWLVSFVADYLVALRSVPHNAYLAGFWATSFAPIPPTTLADLHWFREAALGLVYLGFLQMGTAFREVLPGWFSGPVHALLALTVLGSVALAFQRVRAAAMGAITLMAVLGASALHQYPFRARLILFLVPFVFLALAALVQQLHELPLRRAAPWLVGGPGRRRPVDAPASEPARRPAPPQLPGHPGRLCSTSPTTASPVTTPCSAAGPTPPTASTPPARGWPTCPGSSTSPPSTSSTTSAPRCGASARTPPRAGPGCWPPTRSSPTTRRSWTRSTACPLPCKPFRWRVEPCSCTTSGPPAYCQRYRSTLPPAGR